MKKNTKETRRQKTAPAEVTGLPGLWLKPKFVQEGDVVEVDGTFQLYAGGQGKASTAAYRPMCGNSRYYVKQLKEAARTEGE